MHIALLLLVTAATLPASVQHALDTQFPQARVTRVEKESGERWEVALQDARGAFEVTFDGRGRVQVEERVVKVDEVPVAVLKRARSVGEVERCERVAAHDKVTWELVVRSHGARIELELGADGALLQRSAATE
jgi:hypothetical protein